jgi:hypothetical protein
MCPYYRRSKMSTSSQEIINGYHLYDGEDDIMSCYEYNRICQDLISKNEPTLQEFNIFYTGLARDVRERQPDPVLSTFSQRLVNYTSEMSKLLNLPFPKRLIFISATVSSRTKHNTPFIGSFSVRDCNFICVWFERKRKMIEEMKPRINCENRAIRSLPIPKVLISVIKEWM